MLKGFEMERTIGPKSVWTLMNVLILLGLFTGCVQEEFYEVELDEVKIGDIAGDLDETPDDESGSGTGGSDDEGDDA